MSRQSLLSHGKAYFLTAKLTFSRQNLLSHGKTYFKGICRFTVKDKHLPIQWRKSVNVANEEDKKDDCI